MEVKVHGVSTRKVDDFVAALGACTGVSHPKFPAFARDWIRSRIVRGFDVKDGETECFRTGLLRSLKTRGLDGVRFDMPDTPTPS
jgi:transposase-like protein